MLVPGICMTTWRKMGIVVSVEYESGASGVTVWIYTGAVAGVE